METNPKHLGELSGSTSLKMVAHTNGIMSILDVLQLMNVPHSIGRYPKEPKWTQTNHCRKGAEFVLTLKALRSFSWLCKAIILLCFATF